MEPNEHSWLRASPPQLLEKQAAHVWRADLDANASRTSELGAVLSPDESARAERFFREADRKRFIVARSFLRLLLGAYTGSTPKSVTFRYGSRGKPHLAKCPAPLSFNLSHSAGKALFAIAPEGEIGVDLEWQNPQTELLSAAPTIFAPGEFRWFSEPGVLPHTRFFDLWCRKEAYVKARATGFSVELPTFDVFRPDSLAGFALTSFHPFPHFSAALAAKPAPTQLFFYDFA